MIVPYISTDSSVPPDAECVARLRELLDLAHSGGLECVAIAGVLANGQVFSWSGGSGWQPFTLAGLLQYLQGRVLETVE